MKRKDLIRDTQDATAGEIVLYDNTVSRKAHQELFRFDAEKYVACKRSSFDCLTNMHSSVRMVHLSLCWENILSIAAWKKNVSIGEIIYLLREVGLTDHDINPFRKANVGDIFPALYYGKNFDALRKICNVAKKVAEERLRDKGYRINCHLVAEDSKRIVASSL